MRSCVFKGLELALKRRPQGRMSGWGKQPPLGQGPAGSHLVQAGPEISYGPGNPRAPRTRLPPPAPVQTRELGFQGVLPKGGRPHLRGVEIRAIQFCALGRKAGPGGWKLWKATLGRDRVEVGCVEQFLCFSCPGLCACSFSCLAHLGRKKHRLFPLPMDPQPWEQRLAHSTTSAERL